MTQPQALTDDTLVIEQSPTLTLDASTTRDETRSETQTMPDAAAAAAAIDVEITRDEILDVDDVRVIPVHVDEWKKGAVVYVHTPSAADKDHLEQVLLLEPDPENDGKMRRRSIGRDEIRAYFVAMCTRNKAGERLFLAQDIARLKRKNVVVMDRIYQAVLDASIITEKDVDALAKNSDAASSDS